MAALAEVDDELKKSVASHDLCVSHFRLNQFPMQLFQANGMEMLRRLDISFNYITVLPKEIGLLTNLRILLIGSNPISYLPEEIATLTKIEEMDIRNTKIAEVPLVISVLKEAGVVSGLFSFPPLAPILVQPRPRPGRVILRWSLV